MNKLNLGYVCINLSLSAQQISSNKGMIKRTFDAKGKNYAGQLAYQNLQDLLKILKWNFENNIHVFRMSSCIFPWMSSYNFNELSNYESILQICKTIGEYAKQTNQRLSFHPGHFNILASPNESVVNNSITDLSRHGEIMDMMNLEDNPYNSINIHVGGAYGNKSESYKRFMINFDRLPDNVKSRLTIENDDKQNMYSVIELYNYLSRPNNIPIVFDFFHHNFCDGDLTTKDALEMAMCSWLDSGIKPLTHYSSSKKIHEDSNSKPQAHADYVYEKIETFGNDIDIELECKAKELGLIKYIKDFSQ